MSHYSLEEPYAMHTAQAQQNAHLAADVSGGALPHSDLELTTAQANLPQHLHFLHQQAAQQSTDLESMHLKQSGKSTSSNQKQSRRGGHGTPLGQSDKGRGRGRHRVAIG